MTLFGSVQSILPACEGTGTYNVTFLTPTREVDEYRQVKLSFAESITIDINLQPKIEHYYRYPEGTNEGVRYDGFIFTNEFVLSVGDRCSVFSTLLEVDNVRRWPTHTEITLKDIL